MGPESHSKIRRHLVVGEIFVHEPLQVVYMTRRRGKDHREIDETLLEGTFFQDQGV